MHAKSNKKKVRLISSPSKSTQLCEGMNSPDAQESVIVLRSVLNLEKVQLINPLL